MIDDCNAFLESHIKALSQYDDSNVFYDQMKLDFVKDNDYAVLYGLAKDSKKPTGRKVWKEKNVDNTAYTYTIQRYSRTLIYRIIFYAPREDIDTITEGFEQAIAEVKKIYSSGIDVKVVLDDTVRNQEKRDRRLKRPEKTIIRISFEGGLYLKKDTPIIQDVNIQVKED